MVVFLTYNYLNKTKTPCSNMDNWKQFKNTQLEIVLCSNLMNSK